jgi:hypothetical protein|tara:strand:- start:276 stop:452 length:177 start_codon:yes stop_codon:yes gene_type:complete
MKTEYKLVYKENDELKTVISNDPQVILLILNDKIPAHVSKYRNSAKFELVSYEIISEA